MALIATGEGESNYELPEAGTYIGRCIQVVDLGTHPNTHPQAKPGAKKHEVMIIWELSELMEDGRPFTVNRRYTLSLGDAAKLRAHLESWRGKKFTETELAGFDITTLLDVPCTIGVVHSKNGKYANVDSLAAPMKGVKPADRVNPLVSFTLDDNEGTYGDLWPWVQRIIASSEEGKAKGLQAAEKRTEGEAKPEVADDDLIPF